MGSVIKIENLSKQYRLGKIGTGSLAHDLNRWWHTIRGREDPYLKIGEENDRTQKVGSSYVWALKDINFEVGNGEVLGIIGRNGAGKSTLLKILSRTTSPTTGSVKIKGRIASLLEVGTGFHPELTGRENIFLNGAILGMRKNEIKVKFDEILDFAGVEKYIDTPVKRYSSGMYVRLAFAVAAHLEPEILIVDEVLAVGDIEFQKKALGKMKSVSSSEGRTVLFVSHNISAINQLTKNCVLLQNGLLTLRDKTEIVLTEYNKLHTINQNALFLDTSTIKRPAEGSPIVLITAMSFKTSNVFLEAADINFNISLKIFTKIDSLRFSLTIFDHLENAVGSSFSEEYLIEHLHTNDITLTLPNPKLAPGIYYITIAVGKGNHITGYKNYDVLQRTLQFEVISQSTDSNKSNASVWYSTWGHIQFNSILIS